MRKKSDNVVIIGLTGVSGFDFRYRHKIYLAKCSIKSIDLAKYKNWDVPMQAYTLYNRNGRCDDIKCGFKSHHPNKKWTCSSEAEQ